MNKKILTNEQRNEVFAIKISMFGVGVDKILNKICKKWVTLHSPRYEDVWWLSTNCEEKNCDSCKPDSFIKKMGIRAKMRIVSD